MPDAREDPSTVMAAAERTIAAGVDATVAAWAERAVERILDAWGRLDDGARAAATAAARAAGEQTRSRLGDELAALFATPVERQRTTPLEIVRGAGREATAVLAGLGIPPVERDPFDARVFPDDVYDLAPRSMAELGDEELGPALLVWGVAKSRRLREPDDPDAAGSPE